MGLTDFWNGVGDLLAWCFQPKFRLTRQAEALQVARDRLLKKGALNAVDGARLSRLTVALLRVRHELASLSR